MGNDVKQMKWWGWGDHRTEFDIENRPNLWPFIKKVLSLNGPLSQKKPIDYSSIKLPPQSLNNIFLKAIQTVLRPEQIKQDDNERLLHSYGKSYRDLWRIRHGLISSAPDIVVYPESEDDVVQIIIMAHKANVVVIPFGGGSNIVGGIETKDQSLRMVVSLDMKRMNKLIDVDLKSNIAMIQAGVLGPELEYQLNLVGVTLGHFPDSFEHSTLGGWVATRSAGMQSDQYGKIEDMVIALRMVTPTGTVVTRVVPKCSNGININHLCIGSEGILGIITEVTLQIHPIPEKKDYYGYLFPNFDSGITAIQHCVKSKCLPVITRLNDPEKTALSFAYKSKNNHILKKLSSYLIKKYLNFKKFNLESCCLMIVGFEGSTKYFRQHKKNVHNIFRQYGSVFLGTPPGRAFEKGKYDFPYLRDFVMDYNIMADVSETATVWSNVLPLYAKTSESIKNAIIETGSVPWVGCHVSHNYQSGASLYFTFACQHQNGQELQQYTKIKKAAEDAFLTYGGTLSHHHAVGYEHMPWIEKDISAVGVMAVASLKKGLDPHNIMNPGKLIPPSSLSVKSESAINYRNDYLFNETKCDVD